MDFQILGASRLDTRMHFNAAGMDGTLRCAGNHVVLRPEIGQVTRHFTFHQNLNTKIWWHLEWVQRHCLDFSWTAAPRGPRGRRRGGVRGETRVCRLLCPDGERVPPEATRAITRDLAASLIG